MFGKWDFFSVGDTQAAQIPMPTSHFLIFFFCVCVFGRFSLLLSLFLIWK